MDVLMDDGTGGGCYVFCSSSFPAVRGRRCYFYYVGCCDGVMVTMLLLWFLPTGRTDERTNQ